MPTSNRANKKKPCIAAKTTDTSSCQTFHYASHSGVVSFVSPLVQQHCPFCQSSCLGHHPQDVPGKAGSSHARSTSSRARQSPLCPFSSMRPTLTVQSSSSKWDFFLQVILQRFFSPAVTKEFSLSRAAHCPCHPEKLAWAWCLA